MPCGALISPVHPLLFLDPDKEVQVPSLSCLPEVLCPLVLWAHPCTPRLAHNQLSCVLTGLWWVQIISAISPSFSFLQSVTASAVLPTAGVAPLLCHSPPLDSSHCLGPPNSAQVCLFLCSDVASYPGTLLPEAALVSCGSGFISAPRLHQWGGSRASPGLPPKEHFTPKMGSVRWRRKSSL